MPAADRREARQRWLRGWALAAALHLAVAAAVVAGPWSSPPRAIALSEPALALELAPLPSAPAAPPSDAPAAPSKQEAARERTPQRPQRKPPLLVPARHAEVQARTAEAPTDPVMPPQVASVEAAPPPSVTDQRPEHVAAAPLLGTAARPSADAAANWESQVLARLDRAKRYPPEARWSRQQDTVFVEIALDRSGRLLSAHIGRSRGFQALDDEVLDLVRRVSPFLPPPPEIAGDPVALRVPVDFYIGSR